MENGDHLYSSKPAAGMQCIEAHFNVGTSSSDRIKQEVRTD